MDLQYSGKQEGKRRVGTLSRLPFEVLENIVSRLPLKSIVSCTSVSKSLQAFVSEFSQFYSVQQSKSRNLFLMTKPKQPGLSCKISFSLVEFEHETFQIRAELGNPIGDEIPMCSCNGIVLLRNPTDHVYALWNPWFRKYTRIRLENESFGTTFWHLNSYGLYYDSTSNDYKVVVVNWKHYNVFSCTTGIWAEKRLTPCGFPLYRTTFLDGPFWWVNYDQGTFMCFDVVDDKFKTLQPPPLHSRHVKVLLLCGRLCYYYSKETDTETKFKLWVVQKNRDANYCWKEVMNTEKKKPHRKVNEPIWLTNEDDVVMGMEGFRYVIYNHNYKIFGEEKIFGNKCMFASNLLLCTQSLVFPLPTFNSY